MFQRADMEFSFSSSPVLCDVTHNYVIVLFLDRPSYCLDYIPSFTIIFLFFISNKKYRQLIYRRLGKPVQLFPLLN